MSETRPRSVVHSERLAYLAVALEVVSLALYWPIAEGYFVRQPIFYPLVVVSVFAIQVWWISLIVRKGKNWARWISVLIVGIGIPQSVLNFHATMQQGLPTAIVHYAVSLLFVVAIALLFLHDANVWFKSGRREPV